MVYYLWHVDVSKEPPVKKNSDDQLSKVEIERRFSAALGRALTTPHKPQKKKMPNVVKRKKPNG